MPDCLLSKNVFQQVFAHVTRLYTAQMSSCLFFHTFNHTLEVLEACKEISLHINISSLEQEIVWIAACFHDTGYRYIYMGHEEESKRIAYQFLTSIKYRPEKIERVLRCIDATKIPQKPQVLIEQVLCDADLYRQIVFYIGNDPVNMPCKLSMPTFELIDLQSISYKEFINSNIPEEVLLAILCNFEETEAMPIVRPWKKVDKPLSKQVYK